MRVVILAGGMGTRLGDEEGPIPKPMVAVGDKPLLFHIMSHYAAHGFKDFIVAAGFRASVIENWASSPGVFPDDWKVVVRDTGVETGSGGRLRRLASEISGETFMVTYGDGLSDVDLKALADFHARHRPTVTLLAVHPPARFGELKFQEGDGERDKVTMIEKSVIADVWINGGYMVAEPELLESIEGDSSSLEFDALQPLSAKGAVMAFRHDGFWECIDTPLDLEKIRRLWEESALPGQRDL